MSVLVNGIDSPELDMDKSNVQEELSVEKLYEMFSLQASDFPEVMDTFQALKAKLGVEKLYGLELYRELKAKLGARNSKTWKAREVLNMLEKRANQKEYMEQKAATNIRVLIVGAGPVGLRLAIDCILLGAEVVVVEKRDTFSRNNVLHLWPFTIEDLKQLGAKKFYGKFCAGAIDHISIRSLQCILLKLCLLLGVKIYPRVEFLEILEPNDQIGWHASVEPEDHPVSQFEFDFIVGAEGARKSQMPGFDRKELRGKLALAITANFKNYYTRDEAAVEEISGVAFIFNQKFFKDLKADTDIDLENIVYYKDDTHYFVMTAKKDSLLRKEVLVEDYSDTMRLLNRDNIDEGRLWDYATEAAAWSTELPKLDFAFNHHSKPDVALFDFTSIHQAEYAARAIRRGGKDLYLCLVGDALLEPFWPTGTGCARGFLGAMDTAWLIRGAGQGKKVLDLLCERECIFQRLPQTTPEKLQQNIKTYTIDPQTRYPNIHFHRVKPSSVQHLYNTDESSPNPALRPGSVRVKKTTGIAEGGNKSESSPNSEEGVVKAVSPTGVDDDKENVPSKRETRSVTSPSRKPLMDKGEVHRAYYVNIDDDSLHTLRDHHALVEWLRAQVKPYGIEVKNLSSSWSSGMALCALIHRYRPDLIPNFHQLNPEDSIGNNQLAFSLAEKHLAISSLIKPTEMKKPDKLALFTYLSLFYELFEDEEPVELDLPAPVETRELSPLREEGSEDQFLTSGEVGSSPEKSLTNSQKKKKKSKKRMIRRQTKKSLATSPASVERSWSSRSFQRPNFTPPTSPTGKTADTSGKTVKTETTSTLTVKPPGTGTSTAPSTSAAPRTPKSNRSRPLSSAGGSQFKVSAPDSSDFCYFCGKRVYLMERMSANGLFFHRNCFKCSHCNCKLKMGNYSLSKGEGGEKGKFFCSVHYRQLFMSNPEAINYSRADAPKRETSKTSLSAEKEKTPPKTNEQEPIKTEQEAAQVSDSTGAPELVVSGDTKVTVEEAQTENGSSEGERTNVVEVIVENNVEPSHSLEEALSTYVVVEEPSGEGSTAEEANPSEGGRGEDGATAHQSGDEEEEVISISDVVEVEQVECTLHLHDTQQSTVTTSETLPTPTQSDLVTEPAPVDWKSAPPLIEPEQPLTTETSTVEVLHDTSACSDQESEKLSELLELVEEIVSHEYELVRSPSLTDIPTETRLSPIPEHEYECVSFSSDSETAAGESELHVTNTTDITTVWTPEEEKRVTPKPARKAPPPPMHKQDSKESTASNSPKDTRTTPKPARKAPPPPLLTQVSRESSAGDSRPPSSQKGDSSPNTPLSPTGTSKTRSSSDPPTSSDESHRRLHSSRSRSSSVEIDENFHRLLDQDDKKPVESSQDSELGSSSSSSLNTKSANKGGRSSSSVRQPPVRPAPYRPTSDRKTSGPVHPAPYRQTSGSPIPARPAPSRPTDRRGSGSPGPARPPPPTGSPTTRRATESPVANRRATASPVTNRRGTESPVPTRPPPPSGQRGTGSPGSVRQASKPRTSTSPDLNRKAPDRPAPYKSPSQSRVGGGVVKRLSMGFEQLEANAKETEIQLGAKGRERAKANILKAPSSQNLLPYQQLGAINEEKNPGEVPRPVSPNSFKRPRSSCEWKGTLGRSRKPPDEVLHIPRSSQATSRSSRYGWERKPKRGQRSVTRSLSNYSSSDVAIQERRKQQRRFRDAQLIQREMSQLERQYDELEEVGRDIENALRECEDSVNEDNLMKSWIGLVNERNGLVRKTAELSLKMKELELEDKQYEVDKELAELSQVPPRDMTKQDHRRFEELCEMKLKVVEERNEIVMQTEEERVRELEEDVTTTNMFDRQFGAGGSGATADEESSSEEEQFRDSSQKTTVVNGVSHKNEKRKSNRLSGLLSFFSSK